MAQDGKIQLTYVIVAPPAHVAEGDRIFASHAKWMESTHHREGPKALLHYSVSKAPALEKPFDPSSKQTGNTCYVLTEVYESDAGVTDHFEQAQASWEDSSKFLDWLGKCQVTGAPAATIFNSLW